MKQESLDKALDVIINDIASLDIDVVDRCELLINLEKFLMTVDEYNHNVNVLNMNNVNKRGK